MVSTPADYLWSSYHANALGRDDGLTQPHDVYQLLGETAEARQCSYRALFLSDPDPDEVQSLREAIKLCVPAGNDRFKAEIDRRLQRRISYRPRGRPARAVVSPEDADNQRALVL